MSAYFELLAMFISKNALFLQDYGNWLLVPLIALIFLTTRWVQKRMVWPWSLRWALWGALFAVNFTLGSLLYMTNWPLKPLVNSLAKVQRNIGKPMNDFSFVLLEGDQKQTLTDYRGRIVVLNFWATYCGGCLEEFPDLKRLDIAYADDLVVLALSDEDRDKLTRVVPRLNAPVHVGYYQNQNWMQLESFRPVTVIVDREGIVREFSWGRHSYDELVQMVNPYL